MSAFYQQLGVGAPFDASNRFSTSWILPTAVFAGLRILFSVYAFVTIFFILAWDCTHGKRYLARRWFSYFTNLTYFGLAFYYLFAGLHSLSHSLRGRSWLNTWPRPFQAAHTIFYSTVVTFPLLVTTVFWVILYNGTWFREPEQAWSNVSQHGLNSLYALVEIILPRTHPPPLLHLAFLIFILALYVGLAYLSHTTEGIYVYSFLDPAKGSGRVAAYSFGILAAILVIFGVVWCLIWTRGWVARRLRLDYDGAGGRRTRTQAMMEERDMIELPEEVK